MALSPDLAADFEFYAAQNEYASWTYTKEDLEPEGGAFPQWEFLAASLLEEDDGSGGSGTAAAEQDLRVLGSIRAPRQSGYEGTFAAVVELAFRGTACASNWSTNLAADLVPLEIGHCKGLVHRGFQTAYLALRADVLAKVRAGLATHLQDGRCVLCCVTGHSMGGALATLASYDLAYELGCHGTLRCTTWGSPRVGDAEFVGAISALVPDTVRFVNKLDPVPRVPSNPSDPNDDGPVMGNLMRSVLAKPQSLLGAAGYIHVCKGVLLDPETSRAAHLLASGVEAFDSGVSKASNRVMNSLFVHHRLPSYRATLDGALRSFQMRSPEAWHKRPSVGTWISCRPFGEEESIDELFSYIPDLASITARPDVERMLDYGSSMLADLKERGPCVMFDVKDEFAHYTTKQLQAWGLEPDESGKIPLEDVLQQGPDLLQSEKGTALLRDAQDKLLTLVPIMEAASREAKLSSRTQQLRDRLEASEAGKKALRWGEEQLAAAEADPDLLKTWMSSLSLSTTEGGAVDLGGWHRELFSADTKQERDKLLSKAREKCWEYVQDESTQNRLSKIGIEIGTDGEVHVDKALEKGKQLLDSEEGAEMLRSAQEAALGLLPMLEKKMDGLGISEQSQAALRMLEDNQAASELLNMGREKLKAAEQDPEALRKLLASVDTEGAADLGHRLQDKEARDKLLDHIKNLCLTFLLEQLPTVKIPDITSDGADREYSLRSIQLVGIDLQSRFLQVSFLERVQPADGSSGDQVPHANAIPEEAPLGDVLSVSARSIGVDIGNIRWTYAQKSFPYAHGEGAASARVIGAFVELSLRLERVQDGEEVAPQFALSQCRVGMKELQLDIKESMFSWLYNTLAQSFRNNVRWYVVQALERALVDNIQRLLTPLNEYLRPYWGHILSMVGLPLGMLPLAAEAPRAKGAPSHAPSPPTDD